MKSSTILETKGRMKRSFIATNAWTIHAVMAALMALPSAGLAGPGKGFSVKVVKSSNGTAKVTFQPVTANDKVTIYNKLGERIGELNWAASFETSVTEKALGEATTKEGIDLNSLLRGIGTVKAGDKTLVSARLPYSVQDLDGRNIAPGTQVFFGLEGLARKGTVAPVSAWGGAMGPGGAANEFNDRLLTSGVKPLVAPKGSPSKVPVKPAAKPAAHTHSHGVHGDGITPLDQNSVRETLEAAGVSTSSDRILSSPTCTNSSSQSLRMSSYFGERDPFKTKNGATASRNHRGLDIAGRPGTPIVAAADGCVSLQGMRFNKKAGYGLTVRMDHAKGISTQYSHMQNFTPEIRAWAKSARKNAKYCVARGTPIGYVGATGNCSGPHLHFGVNKNGRAVNPLKYMLTKSNGDLSNTCSTLQAKNEMLKPLDEALAALSNKSIRSDVYQTAAVRGGTVRQ